MCEYLLGHYDDNITAKASEQDKTAPDITTTTFGREQVDQGENISNPAEQDQNHENVRVMGATKNQHEAEARDGSQDQDQNYRKNDRIPPPLQVQSHLEMPGILVQLGHIQRT